MAESSGNAAAASQAQFDDHVRQSPAASETEKAKQMIDNGAIIQAEFDAIKAKAIGSATPV